MEKIKTEEAGRKRGRPKLDAHITEEYAPSRRQALNKMYMYEGVYLANLAIAAVQNGYTSREVEIVLREIRMAAKSSMKNPDDEALYCALGNTVDILRSMGGIT